MKRINPTAAEIANSPAAKLAAKLTNWKIDIKSESQFREMIMAAQNNEEVVEETTETEE